MLKKKKRTAVRVILVYLILTIGSWMFLNSYANSYNRLSDEKIAPASLNLNGGTAEIQILEHTVEFSLSWLDPDSRFYCGAYILSPDELRLTAYLISFCNNI